MAERVVVTNAVRTPIGKFMGGLASMSAVQLGEHVVRTVLAESQVGSDGIDEVIFGHARQAGCGPNPARQVAIGGGVAETAPAWTINQACASGLAAIAMGADAIRTERASIVLVGGMESMTNTPYLLPRARMGYRLGHAELTDGMYQDGFNCPLAGTPMGRTAETLAEQFDLTRDEQDAYAAESQRRAAEAIEANRFADEIRPIEIVGRKGTTVVAADEHPRPGTTAEKLAKLPPVFKKDGTVHAGNSSGITDGAAALLLMTESEARKRGLPVLGVVGPSGVAALDPRVMGLGPVPATKKLFDRLGRTFDDYDLIELNEAFAAQVLACAREMPFPLDRTNVNGGSIALGHPIGMTGARIVVTLLHEMARRGSSRGLATLCVSGGMGYSVEFEQEG